MSHLSDDDLVLHYYGEDGRDAFAAERHLQTCAQCGNAYEALTRTLMAVTPPEFVDAPDDTVALRKLLREHVRDRSSSAAVSVPVSQAEPGLIALAWLVPILYPFSFRAIFTSAQWAHDHLTAIALVALTLLWACAGPFVAVLALNRLAQRFDRLSARVLVLGAVLATICPPLFLLISRGSPSLSRWYSTLAVAALMALIPWRASARSTLRLQVVHRVSALLLGLFVLAHIVNQALAFVSVPSYAAMRSVMRVASQQPVSYAVIVTAVAVQIATGVSMAMRRVRAGAFARNLQVVSGWYLAAFLFSHVFAAFLFSRPAAATAVATAPVPLDVLANSTATAALPYYLLGVAAFLFHVGVYVRLAALAWLADAAVRRLSYAAALVATTIVVTVGLGLCGVHLLR